MRIRITGYSGILLSAYPISSSDHRHRLRSTPALPFSPSLPVPPPGAEGDRYSHRGEAASAQSKPAIFCPHLNSWGQK